LHIQIHIQNINPLLHISVMTAIVRQPHQSQPNGLWYNLWC